MKRKITALLLTGAMVLSMGTMSFAACRGGCNMEIISAEIIKTVTQPCHEGHGGGCQQFCHTRQIVEKCSNCKETRVRNMTSCDHTNPFGH